MPFSPRMNWPVPKEGQDPWFEAFQALVNAVDASSFTHRENDPVVLMEGGILTFTASSGLLTWAGTIEMNASITGFRWNLPTGSVNIQEGEVLYVTLSRSPASNQTVTAVIACRVPTTDEVLFLAVRRNNKIYWRNGKVLLDGESVALFETSGGGGGGGGLTPLAIDSQTPDVPYTVAGGLSFDASTFSTITFETLGSVSSGGLDGDIQLFNLTDVAVVTTTNFTETTPTGKSSSVSLPSGAKVYEVRIRLTNGGGPSDLLFARWAGLSLA